MDSVYAAAYPELYRKHWWWRVREEILLQTISRLLANTPEARILDVGCGAGLFFDALNQFGHVEGIESDTIALQAAGNWRPRIHAGELDDAFSPGSPYDLILMLDVIEHLAAPVDLLGRASKHLRRGGRLLITVPAFNWLWTRHDDLNHHLERYSARSLRTTIAAAGLVTESTTYLFPSLVLPKALVRVRESVMGGTPQVPRLPSPGVSRLVQSVLRVEHSLLPWAPFGTSLMAVARPR